MVTIALQLAFLPLLNKTLTINFHSLFTTNSLKASVLNRCSAQTEIEPAIFRFIAQHLNHCATAVPDECILHPIVGKFLPEKGGGGWVVFQKTFV